VVFNHPQVTSPDHSALPIGEEFYSIELEGEVTRLTYLTDTYSKVRIGKWNWSPDGRDIALWLEVEPVSYPNLDLELGLEPAWRLAVFNTVTKVETNYCFPGGNAYVAPLWSPDGRQIVVQNVSQTTGKEQIFLVDIASGSAGKIAEDLVPVGWMVNSP
jgi:Tol biopolymer transport system component